MKSEIQEKKIKCACPGCGRDFMESKGVDKLYCTEQHKEIALIIEASK